MKLPNSNRVRIRFDITADSGYDDFQFERVLVYLPYTTVRTPKRKGFGSRLIEGSIAGTLGGSVSIDYDPAGIVARLSFPFSATAH